MFGSKSLQCRGVKKAGWKYLDDTLPSGRRNKIEKHLTTCVNCRTEYSRRMGILEALKQGMPVDMALVRGAKSSSRHLLRLALTGAMITFIFAAGWYALSISDFGTRLADWKTSIVGIFATSSSAVIEEKTATGTPPEDAAPSEPQPPSLAVSTPAVTPPSTVSVRSGRPHTKAVMQLVNSEPRTQSSLGKTKAKSKEIKVGKREWAVVSRKDGKADMKSPNPPISQNNPKSATRNPNLESAATQNPSSSLIQVYDESGQLIKSEQIKAGGKK